jgi:DNA invertase Pin-like site-specific DNA recombinase
MNPPNETILNVITSGAFRDRYLLYARRSTDDIESQKNSIKYQHQECARYAKNAGLPIADVTLGGFSTGGVISERHSGFTEDVAVSFGGDHTVQYRVERPKFYQLLRFLAEGRFKGVIVLCWDRASRNKGDDTILRKLMKAGVDIRFARTEYDKGSAGELHMDIDGMFAEHHSRLTREKVTDTMRKKRDEGYCTHKAPVGYLNEGVMEHKPLDPERAPIIRELFKVADRMEWSLADLRRWLIEQGFTMRPARRARTTAQILADEERDEWTESELTCRLPGPSTVHNILKNRFYTGRVVGNGGTWVPSRSHEALVDDATFERVQAKLTKRRTSIRYDKKLDHPFRGFVRCECKRTYTPYEQKGSLYYGARCDRNCPNTRKSVNLDFVFRTVGGLLKGLSFTDRELAQIEEAAERRDGSNGQRQDAEHDPRERRTRKLRADLAYLADNRITILRTGVYTAEALAAEHARLSAELDALVLQQAQPTPSLTDAVRAVVKCSELLKSLCQRYEIAEKAVKEQIARSIFSELTLSENTPYFQCTTAFRPFESRVIQSSALDEWLSELTKYHRNTLDATLRLEALLNDEI